MISYHIASNAKAHVRSFDLAEMLEVAFQDEDVEYTAEHADGADPFVPAKGKYFNQLLLRKEL